MCFPFSVQQIWGKFHFWGNLSDIARHPSGVVGRVIISSMYSSMMAWQTFLTASDWVLWGTHHAYFMVEYLLPEARQCKVSASFRPSSRDSLYIIEHLGGYTHEILERSLILVSELHQKLVVKAKLLSPSDAWSHPGTSFSSSLSSSYEVNYQIDQIILLLPPSSLAGCPRLRTEEDLKVRANRYTFLKRR